MRETMHNFKIKFSRTSLRLILVLLAFAILAGVAQAVPPLRLKYVAPTGAVNISNPTVKASVNRPQRVAAARLSLNGGPSSSCTLSGSTISCPTSGLVDGSYQAVVSVDDSRGGTVFVSGNFKVDTVQPVVSSVLPTGFINTSSTTVSVSYSDGGSGIKTDAATMNLDGSALSGCQVTATSMSCAATGLAQGSHNISGTVSDNSGNKTDYQGSFVVDTAPPVVTYGGPSGNISENNPTIYGTASDSSPVTAELELSGQENKKFACTVSAPEVSCPTTDLADGSYTAVIRATDAAGNAAGSPPGSFAIGVSGSDLTPPKITYTGSTGNTNAPVISATYSDQQSGINQASVSVKDGEATLACTVTASQVSCPTEELAEGTHSLTISVADNAGNTATATATFIFDQTSPQVTNVQPSGTVDSTSATVSADYADSGSGVDTASTNLTLDGSGLSGCTATASSITCPVTGLAQGSHVIGGSVADNAGNTAPVSGSFTVTTSTEAPHTVISLTFDDGRASQPNAGAILAAHGVYGTFFVNSIQLGTSNYYMSLNDVRNLANAGNEIGGHTLHHYDLTQKSASTVTTEVCEDQQQLQAWGFPAVSLAYPYGTTNSTVESIVSSCKERGYNIVNNYRAARIVGGLQCSGCDEAESIPPADPYSVRTAGGSPTSSTTLDQLKTMVTRAESTGGWLVIPFHSVCSAPATAPVPGNAGDCNDKYSIAYSNLDQFVAWLVSRSSVGTAVKTVSEVMGMPAPPPPPPPTPGANLVQNPSLELDENGDNKPDGFLLGGYGTNTYSYTRVSSGAHSGTYAEQLTITSLTSGDRKVVTAQDGSSYSMVATPGKTYQTSVWYTSDKPVQIVVYYHDGSGWHYWSESPFSGPASDWTQIVWNTPAMPAGADLWSFGPALTSVGTMTVDDFSAGML